jgi:hypothetical protein
MKFKAHFTDGSQAIFEGDALAQRDGAFMIVDKMNIRPNESSGDQLKPRVMIPEANVFYVEEIPDVH